jgi:hypothetical protein
VFFCCCTGESFRWQIQRQTFRISFCLWARHLEATNQHPWMLRKPKEIEDCDKIYRALFIFKIRLKGRGLLKAYKVHN